MYTNMYTYTNTYTPENIKKVLADHLLWLTTKGSSGTKADFQNADLRGIVFDGGVNLSEVNFQNADLTEASLIQVGLKGANLKGANLTEANLSAAYLQYANLTDANLFGADLRDANLNDVNLTNANLRLARLNRTKLKRTNLTNTKLSNYQIPQSDSLIGYKQVSDLLDGCKCILKLEIPPEAKRTGCLISNKCRTEFAKVIGWRNKKETEFHTESRRFVSLFNRGFFYEMGGTIKTFVYDSDPRVECTSGLHFFINESDAQHYIF